MKLPSALDDVRTEVLPAIRSAFASLSPEIRAVVEYHMGWRDAQGISVDQQSSKGVRPGLALLAAAAADHEPVQVAIPGAIAVEALHNCAFLLDDVMDDDRSRRQRETAWVVFGKGLSTLAGTSLFVLGTSTLLAAESPHRQAALELYSDTFSTMLAGQAIDLQMEGANLVSVERCLLMTEWKTASLMRCATTMGATLAGASNRVLSGLRSFGESLGVAFQARDDLLGIWGQPHETGGRPVGFDLRARKSTLPVAYSLASGDAAAEELSRLLTATVMTAEDVVLATKLIERCGGRERTMELANRNVDTALAVIDELGLPEDISAGFTAIAQMGRPDYRA